MGTKTFRIGKNSFEYSHTHTLGVLGGAYSSRNPKGMLTHLVFCHEGRQVRVACRQPLDNMADEYSVPQDALKARPTCPTCAKKWDQVYGSL